MRTLPRSPSLLLKERIVYLGLPLFSDDDAKRQLGMDVTELIIAQLLYLEFEDPEKPIYFYINSTEQVGTLVTQLVLKQKLSHLRYNKLHQASSTYDMYRTSNGTAAVILSSGTKGQRAALPHASIVLHQPISGARGQATDIQIRAEEVLKIKNQCWRFIS